MKNGKAHHDPGPMPPMATYCRHCNESFPVALPILGEPSDTQYVRATAQLAQHIQMKHKEEMQKDVGVQVQLSIGCSAQCVLRHFTSSDDGLMEWETANGTRFFEPCCAALSVMRRSAPRCQRFSTSHRRAKMAADSHHGRDNLTREIHAGCD